jgi:hypothetical protein
MTHRSTGTVGSALAALAEIQASLAIPAAVAASTQHPGRPPVPAAIRAAVHAVSGSPRPNTPRPRADCTADSAGGLTFDVRLTEDTGGPGDAGSPNCQDSAGSSSDAGDVSDAWGDAALLLRRRGDNGGPADTVRLPLGPGATDGTLRAVLPSIMTLPEGRWDAYLAVDDGEPRRLLPGVHDLRSLIGRVPRQGRTWLGVRIPYATKYGNLTVRSWLRWPHAEAGKLSVTDGGMVLHGRLYGARLGGTARLEAYARGVSAAPVVVPVTRGGGPDDPAGPDGGAGGAGGGEVEAEEGQLSAHFTAELSLAALPAAYRKWDLWLRPEEGAEPVRIARILDDVPDKKRIFSYPPQRVTDRDGDRVVGPYYTLDNDLSVHVSCADAA